MKWQESVGGECSAAIGSVTQAQKAQRALAEAAIPATVVKWENSSRLLGCVYGVRFACAQANNVRTVLASARISVKQWNDGV